MGHYLVQQKYLLKKYIFPTKNFNIQSFFASLSSILRSSKLCFQGIVKQGEDREVIIGQQQ